MLKIKLTSLYPFQSLSLGFPDLERLSEEDSEKIKGSVFQASYDPEPEIAEVAKKLWATRGFERDFSLSKPLLLGRSKEGEE